MGRFHKQSRKATVPASVSREACHPQKKMATSLDKGCIRIDPGCGLRLILEALQIQKHVVGSHLSIATS